ncbi:hypothetical protein L0244_10375 [bacterium]|nr:hypothetical protein [bacterium]
MELQTPVMPVTVEKPQAIAKSNIFSSLLNQPTVNAAELLGGEKTEWINTMEECNPLFPKGDEFSRPFFALRAWTFESKSATQKSRMGLKIVLPDGKIFHVSLSYVLSTITGEPMYQDRQVVVEHFEKSSTPIGLMQFEKIGRGHSNTYWRLIYADQYTIELAGEKAETDEEGTVVGVPEDAPF